MVGRNKHDIISHKKRLQGVCGTENKFMSEMKRTEALRGTNVALVFMYAGHPSLFSQFYGKLFRHIFLLGTNTHINSLDSLVGGMTKIFHQVMLFYFLIIWCCYLSVYQRILNKSVSQVLHVHNAHFLILSLKYVLMSLLLRIIWSLNNISL